jgi:hypothetical protein
MVSKGETNGTHFSWYLIGIIYIFKTTRLPFTHENNMLHTSLCA